MGGWVSGGGGGGTTEPCQGMFAKNNVKLGYAGSASFLVWNWDISQPGIRPSLASHALNRNHCLKSAAKNPGSGTTSILIMQ